ncbi:MAG: alpha/beta hydrolase [Lachnospiraceae bacterium]|nr:alpha/beta hydrolase [Lachnospiraceae bacterium]
MSPMMQALKAIHTVAKGGAGVSEEDLKRQRTGMDLFSKLVTIPVGLDFKPLKVKDISCEISVPDMGHDHRHVIMYCHGGGYTCGSINYARVLASKLAVNTALPVFSFEYRLAPENPYPAAIDDAVAVWDHLMLMGYGAKDVFLCGDSAGGNLALELCLQLKLTGRMLPGAVVLFSPWTDMTMSGTSYKEYAAIDPMLTAEYIESCRGAYAGSHADFSLPKYSPLFSEFKDYPPCLIQVGSNEILRSDSELLSQKLSEAGVNTKLEIYEEAWHVFQQMPIRKASRALSNAAEFLYAFM